MSKRKYPWIQKVAGGDFFRKMKLSKREALEVAETYVEPDQELEGIDSELGNFIQSQLKEMEKVFKKHILSHREIRQEIKDKQLERKRESEEKKLKKQQLEEAQENQMMEEQFDIKQPPSKQDEKNTSQENAIPIQGEEVKRREEMDFFQLLNQAVEKRSLQVIYRDSPTNIHTVKVLDNNTIQMVLVDASVDAPPKDLEGNDSPILSPVPLSQA